jgi:hypothetical protein
MFWNTAFVEHSLSPFHCSIFIRFCRDKPFQPEVYDVRGKEPSQEIQLHTWMDATLREIADLLKAAIPAVNEPCRLMFRIVYPDKFGRMVIRTAGFANAVQKINITCDTFKVPFTATNRAWTIPLLWTAFNSGELVFTFIFAQFFLFFNALAELVITWISATSSFPTGSCS